MDGWKRLCSYTDTEDKIVSRLEETGLSSVMKDSVLKEILKPSVEISKMEQTVYDTIKTSSRHFSLNKHVINFN